MKRALLASVLVGVALRVLWCVIAAQQPDTFGDPFAYLNHARDIADGRGYVVWLDGAPTAYYPVGYPALLGGALWLVQTITRTEALVPTIVGLNLVASVVMIVLVHDLAGRLAGERVAQVAAWIVALFPSLVLYTATAHLELVFTALVLVFVRLAWTAASARTLVAAGAVLGLMTLVRPVGLPLVVVAGAWWWRRHQPDWRAAARRVLVVVAVAMAVVVPWSIRSTMLMNGLVFVSTNTGDNLCIGHSPESTGRYHDLTEWCWSGFEGVPWSEAEVERDRANRADAIEYAVSHPVRELWLLWRKAVHLVAHDHEALKAVEAFGARPVVDGGARTTLRWLADGFYFVVGALAVAGVVLARRRRPLPGRGLLLWSGLTLLAVPLVFFGGSRFHVPALPFVAVFAAVAITELRSRSAPEPSPAGRGASAPRSPTGAAP